jgi:hypothetical protein
MKTITYSFFANYQSCFGQDLVRNIANGIHTKEKLQLSSQNHP